MHFGVPVSLFSLRLSRLSYCNEAHYVELPQRCCGPGGAALGPRGRRVWKRTVNTQHQLVCFIKGTRGLWVTLVCGWVCGMLVWLPGVFLRGTLYASFKVFYCGNWCVCFRLAGRLSLLWWHNEIPLRKGTFVTCWGVTEAEKNPFLCSFTSKCNLQYWKIFIQFPKDKC